MALFRRHRLEDCRDVWIAHLSEPFPTDVVNGPVLPRHTTALWLPCPYCGTRGGTSHTGTCRLSLVRTGRHYAIVAVET